MSNNIHIKVKPQISQGNSLFNGQHFPTKQFITTFQNSYETVMRNCITVINHAYKDQAYHFQSLQYEEINVCVFDYNTVIEFMLESEAKEIITNALGVNFRIFD